MTRKAVTIFMVVAVFLGVFLLANPASAKIGEPCPPPNSDRVCIDHDNDSDTPPIHVPPGLFRVCNDDNPKNDNKNCEKIAPPGNGEEVCGTADGETPPDGAVSGILAQVALGIRDNNGPAQLADLIDAIACGLAGAGL